MIKMTNRSTDNQEDWLEKQIESEKCISNLEDCVKSLKVWLIVFDYILFYILYLIKRTAIFQTVVIAPLLLL